MSMIGQIYVSVRGDTSAFERDITALRSIAKKGGTEVSNALNNAINPSKAERGMKDLSESLVRLSQSAKAPEGNFKATANAISVGMQEAAQKVGLTGQQFSALNEKMLRNQAAQTAEASLRAIGKTAGLSKNELKALAIQMGHTATQAEKMASNIDRSQTTHKSFLTSLNGIRNGLLNVSVLAAAVIYPIKQMSEALWEAGRSTKVAENAYKEITGSVANANTQFQFLRKTADELGLNFYTLREGYKGFLAAAQTSKIPMQEVQAIFKSVSNAGAVLGLSNERTSLTFLALEQMMSKGKVSMEEIRRQMGDNIPGAFQLGAKAMGMTVEAFDKAVSAGEVFSDDFLPKFRRALDESFKGGIDESVKAVNKLAESFEGLKNRLAASGFMDALTDSIKKFTGILSDPSVQKGLTHFANMLGEVVFWATSKTSDVIEFFTSAANFAVSTVSTAKDLFGMSASDIDAYVAHLIDAKADFSAARQEYEERETGDSWARTSEVHIRNLNKAISEAGLSLDRHFMSLTDYQKTQAKMLEDESDILKRYSKEPGQELSSLKEKYSLWQKMGKENAEVQKAYLTEIANLEKQISDKAESEANKRSTAEKKRIKELTDPLEEQLKMMENAQKLLDDITVRNTGKEASTVDTEAEQRLLEIVAGRAELEDKIEKLKGKASKSTRDEVEQLKAAVEANVALLKYETERRKEANKRVKETLEFMADVQSEIVKDSEKAETALEKIRTSGVHITDELRIHIEALTKAKEAGIEADQNAQIVYQKTTRDSVTDTEKTIAAAEKLVKAQKKNREYADAMREAFSGAFSNMSKDLNDFFWEADFTFSETFKSFGKMITQMIIQMKVIQPLYTSLFGTSSSSGGGLLSSLWSSVSGLFSGGSSSGYVGFHSGGVVGSGEGSTRFGINPSVFNNAPRFHDGLMPDEYPAILQEGEGVFTEGQMSAMGGSSVAVSVVVQNNTSSKVEVAETPNASGGKDIIVMIDEALGSMVSGNRGKLSQVLNQRGLRPQTVGR